MKAYSFNNYGRKGEGHIDINKAAKENIQNLVKGSEEIQTGKAALEFIGELKKNESVGSKVVEMPEKPTEEQIVDEVEKMDELRKKYMDEASDKSWIKIIRNAPAGMRKDLKEKAIEELRAQMDFSTADDQRIKRALNRLESVIAYYEQL